MVDAQGSATVEQIAEVLGISPTTVRRDLAQIHSRGLIRRTRGGASPYPHIRVGLTLAESRRINPQEKETIGRATAALVKQNDTLMIDGGFTTYQVARNIEASNLTVITNSLDVASALVRSENVSVITIGGELSAVTGTNLGLIAESQIRRFWAGRAILGADAISPTEGLTSPNPLTAQVKNAMIECSHELIVVADHTKLGKFSPYKVASCEEIDVLVTDSKADKAVVEAFREAGVQVIVAGDGTLEIIHKEPD